MRSGGDLYRDFLIGESVEIGFLGDGLVLLDLVVLCEAVVFIFFKLINLKYCFKKNNYLMFFKRNEENSVFYIRFYTCEFSKKNLIPRSSQIQKKNSVFL